MRGLWMLCVSFFPGWKQGWDFSFSKEDKGWVQVFLYGECVANMCGAHNNQFSHRFCSSLSYRQCKCTELITSSKHFLYFILFLFLKAQNFQYLIVLVWKKKNSWKTCLASAINRGWHTPNSWWIIACKYSINNNGSFPNLVFFTSISSGLYCTNGDCH